MKSTATIGIVTVSDRASRGDYQDRGGPALRQYLTQVLTSDWQAESRLISDDQDVIEQTLRELSDQHGCCLIVTTGGTGPAQRDVTPEATVAVCQKLMPGFGELMRKVSLEKVPTAILSRQTAGIRNGCLIVNLPGQPKAIAECLDAVFPAIPYCIDLIGGPRLETDPDRIVAFRPKPKPVTEQPDSQPPQVLQSTHLQLSPLAPEHLQALLDGPDQFRQHFGMAAAPGLRDFFISDDVSDEFLTKLKTATGPDPWQFGFAVVETASKLVVGSAGFKGAPSAAGEVEIAYAIVPDFTGRGYATEAAGCLVKFAFSHPQVTRILAHTPPETSASTRVLTNTGFAKIGEVNDPQDGRVWRWARTQ